MQRFRDGFNWECDGRGRPQGDESRHAEKNHDSRDDDERISNDKHLDARREHPAEHKDENEEADQHDEQVRKEKPEKYCRKLFIVVHGESVVKRRFGEKYPAITLQKKIVSGRNTKDTKGLYTPGFSETKYDFIKPLL